MSESRRATTPLRLLFAGHDLKFADELIFLLRNDPSFTVRTDEWKGLSSHDADQSREAVAWADVVVCEWCGPNAVWYSQHKRPDQRLIVRLHRFELTTEYPHLVDPAAVDALVTVSPYYRELTAQQLPAFAPDRIIEIPNGVNSDKFNRSKLDGARFQIGMIGVVPSRKRLDRALDILETVRSQDPRFGLYTKSQMPWEPRWVWGQPDERRYFEDVFRRVQTSPLLADSVGFDPAGSDVAEWLRGIGTLVSTSDDESFHMAPAEAMASGAVPVILDWPAARSVYDGSWISESTSEAAERVLRFADEAEWERQRQRARDQAVRFDHRLVIERWRDLILGL